MFTSIIVSIVFLTGLGESGRILAIMPTPSYSHQIVFNPLWLALNSRGHHITLFTTDPIKNSNLSDFRQIDWSFAYGLWHEKHNASDIINNFNRNLLKCLNQYVAMMSDIFIQELEHLEVQEIMNNKNEHFDLVIVEYLNPLMLVFSKKFNCPFIGVSPMDITNFIHFTLDNPTSPALFPDFISPFDSEMNFWERTINTLQYIGSHLYFKYYFYPQMDKIIKKYFGNNLPTLEEMQRNVSMVFLNTNPILHNIRPLMSNVLTIGGSTHIDNNSMLPNDVQEFLDSGTQGVIYFSLGTNAKSKDLRAGAKLIFLETFSELPYKVLWKFEDSSIVPKSNIMMKRWLPQQQILRHPNVKVFVTQGGLQSLEEAIHNGIPVVGIPMYIDQYSNVRKVVRKGMGIEVDYDKIEKSALKAAIQNVISDPRYKNAALTLSMLLKEQPTPGIDEAVWWTEYVLKYKDVKYLKPTEVPLHQYLLLDVFALFLFVMATTSYISFICFKCLLSSIKQK